jgi:hypothetical protein
MTPAVQPYSSAQLHEQQEIMQLEQKSLQLAVALEAKRTPEREAELRKLVETIFDRRHALQVAEAKDLTEKLAKLQESLKVRQTKKVEIINRRIKELMGETDDLGWGLQRKDKLSPIIRVMAPSNNVPLGEVPQTNRIVPAEAIPATDAPSIPPMAVIPPQGKADPLISADSQDVKTLELQVKLAVIRLEEAEAALNNIRDQNASGIISVTEVEKAKYNVKKMKIEVELAQRRVEIAREAKESKNVPQNNSNTNRN